MSFLAGALCGVLRLMHNNGYIKTIVLGSYSAVNRQMRIGECNEDDLAESLTSDRAMDLTGLGPFRVGQAVEPQLANKRPEMLL